MHVLQMANEDLQEELRDKQESLDRFQGNDKQPQRAAWTTTALQEEDSTAQHHRQCTIGVGCHISFIS